jgi:hypothetical protein
MGLMGAASFYQILANLTVYLIEQPHSNRDLRLYEEWEVLYYQSKTIPIVRDLFKTDPISDDLVAAVAGLTCYAHMVKDFEAWRQHINGLQEILRIRGGPDTLDANPAIRIGLCW